MTEVLFYHLERSTVERTLPGLLQRSLDRGWRALVRAGSADALSAMDEYLWTYADESFLPHGQTAPEDQPIYLMGDGDPPHGFDVLFLISGVKANAEEMKPFTRAIVMFDEAGAGEARELWKAVKNEGFDATYWRESPSGKWEKAG